MNNFDSNNPSSQNSDINNSRPANANDKVLCAGESKLIDTQDPRFKLIALQQIREIGPIGQSQLLAQAGDIDRLFAGAIDP